MSKAYMRHKPTGLIVSTDGEVYIPYSGRYPAHWTKGSEGARGYLSIKYKGKRYSVHRLVAETFLNNPENKPEVDHISRNRKDNRLDNLRWATHAENTRNTARSDLVGSEGRLHVWEDRRKALLQAVKANKKKRGIRKLRFSDGRPQEVTPYEYRMLKPFKPSQRIWKGRRRVKNNLGG